MNLGGRAAFDKWRRAARLKIVIAHILADLLQRVLAARAGMIADVDQHLDPRQMRRQRSSVVAAPGGPAGSLQHRSRHRCTLRSVRHRPGRAATGPRAPFRPAVNMMTLQLPNDLLQPRGAPVRSAASPLACWDRRKRVGRRRHDAITSRVAASRERFQSSPSSSADSCAAVRRMRPSCTFASRTNRS